MNMSELEKFLNKSTENKVFMDSYKFDPIEEKATMEKNSQIIVIDLTKTVETQESEFQAFIDGLE